jgi:hypothetical protein
MDHSSVSLSNRGLQIWPATEHSLSQIVQRSKAVLVHISAVFPFDLFPDHLVVDENKVNVIHRDFFEIEHLHSILIEDVTNVTLDIGFVFATLHITDSNNPRFPVEYSLRFLRKEDARIARNVIQGLMSAKREGVELPTDNKSSTAEGIFDVGDTQLN